MTRFFALMSIALSLVLTGCHDTRRDVVRGYLQANPPDGFEVVSIPEKLNITASPDGGARTVVAMRYRLTQPTVEMHDLVSLPRSAAVAKRISDVRGWAISSLPAGDPVREAIVARSAAARAAFPTKRVVTPKGTEIESLVAVKLTKTSHGWEVEPQAIDVAAPGLADAYPQIPFEDSANVAAKLDDLEATANQLEESRQKYLAARQLAAERSLAALRSLLKVGNTFEGRLPDQGFVRLIVSQSTGGFIAVVVTVQRANLSSARYIGSLAQRPSGEAVWRAAQVISLSGPTGEPLTSAGSRPILALVTAGNGLAAELREGSGPAVSFKLIRAKTVDLIPDESTQDTVIK